MPTDHERDRRQNRALIKIAIGFFLVGMVCGIRLITWLHDEAYGHHVPRQSPILYPHEARP